MAELKEGDWVLVADAGKALFLVNKGDEVHPHLVVRRKTEHENPADSDQGTDRPGRMPDAGVGQRSALQETDWHELEKDRFADDLADRLYARAHRGDFARIHIAAEPQTLGRLRKAIHKAVAEKVVTELAKDLTNEPLDRLEAKIVAEVEAA
ncbi:host attachment family protein [Albimonas pacifica]|uniref:Protein required for attachment to host cells n=1 Tax=Albimonas pacifica TaxID=1114924 RepID=A0A1I3HLC1_9RHOB|nr:host attachment family protein [Albimonas pacifica]SFI36377.1 Protein required for attachment to host cells [Albimonas pacifica]